MKYFLILFLACASLLSAKGTLYVSNDLRHAYQTAMRLPEMRTLLDEVLEEGSLHICSGSMPNCTAKWDATNRCITIDPRSAHNFGQRVRALMLELHNAKTACTLDQLYDRAASGELDRDGFVEGVERMEHANAVACSKVIQKGVREGLLPKQSWAHFSESFNEYYRVQKRSGHSAVLASFYDRYTRRSPYRT